MAIALVGACLGFLRYNFKPASIFLGDSGSLVLGFLELQAGQAHNRFLNELEDWLSGVTKLSSGVGSIDGEHSVPAYIQALLEQTAEGLERLERTLDRSESDRELLSKSIVTLSDRLSVLGEHMKAEQSVMMSIAESQSALKPVLTRLSEVSHGGEAIDEATRGHIRNLDHRLGHLTNELVGGREKSVEEIRGEIRLLTRTLAAMAEES
jgi:chromosome segregation ATPase